MTPDKFYDKLTEIVKPGTPEGLMYGSESDYPVEVVRFYSDDSLLWQPMSRHGEHIRPLEILIKEEMTTQELDLAKLFAKWSNHSQRTFKRDYGKPSEFWLYLVAYFNGEWVGVRCHVIET